MGRLHENHKGVVIVVLGRLQVSQNSSLSIFLPFTSHHPSSELINFCPEDG
jgi:hypothetical protein